MKKIISILIFAVLPVFATAGGNHADDHDTGSGHGDHKGHDAHGTDGMSQHGHEADAGRPGDPEKVTRTIEVLMKDTMRFVPDQLKFKVGDTVRFIVRNDGKIQHEMVIGSMGELKEHAKMMQANPTMQHEEPNMVSLATGKQSELIWQFDKAGHFDFACLIPGHLEAGMTGKIEVQ